MSIPDSQWRWVRREGVSYGFVNDRWHLSSDGKQTLCGHPADPHDQTVFGEFAPVQKDTACLNHALRLLGINKT